MAQIVNPDAANGASSTLTKGLGEEPGLLRPFETLAEWSQPHPRRKGLQ